MSVAFDRASGREDFAALLERILPAVERDRGGRRRRDSRRDREGRRRHRRRPQDRRPRPAQGIHRPRHATGGSRSATRSRSISSASRTRSAKRCISREKARREESWVKLEKAFENNEKVAGRDLQPGQGRLHRRSRRRRGLPAAQPGRHPPGARRRPADEHAAALPDPEDGPAARQHRRLAPHRPRGEPRRAALASSSPASRKARSSTAWSRTSPTTARSSTSAASTACCTSPTWPGGASTTRPRSCRSARRSRCRSSASTTRRTASRSA